jgi:hypothetical protein
MNARGLPLTDFENFKANIVDFLRKKISDGEWDFALTENDADKKKDENNKWIAGFESKFDNAWTNIFWEKKSHEYKIDQIFFHFIYRYLLCNLITTVKDDKKGGLLSNDAITKEPKKPDENAIEEEKKKYIRISEVYKTYNLLRKDPLTDEAIKQGKREYEEEWLTKSTIFGQETFETLATILDNYSKSIITENDFSASWGDTIQFIPEYIKDTNSIQKLSEQEYITAKQRVVFHAVCKYFELGIFDTTTFKRWMRIVWNIVENTPMTTGTGTMRLIDKLGEHSHDIYNFLGEKDDSGKWKNAITSDTAKEQVEEEREKARKIIEDNSWEQKIVEAAETSAFFKGAIRFLYRTDDDKDVNWDMFDMRFANANNYFDKNGVKDNIDTDGHGIKYKTDALLLKAFVSRIDKPWEYLWGDKCFFDNKSNTWKNILTNHSFRLIMNIILSGDISIANIGKVDWQEKLYKTDILSYISTNMEGSRVRNIHGHKAIYPPRYPGIILDMDVRDNILFELMNDNAIEIDEGQIVAGMPLFRGWDINFKWNKYDDYKFQWNTDRNIYLLTNRNERIKKDNQYLSFPESKEMSKEGYIDRFEDLIQEVI